MHRSSQLLSWRLEALPYTEEVVLEVAEDIGLSTGVRTETLELVGTVSERGGNLGSTLLKPGIRLPLQGSDDTPHLFFEK